LSASPWNERNGWRLYLHRAFREQYDDLVAEASRLKTSLGPQDFREHPRVKLLARINKLILEDVPNDPGAKAYELGNTLGSSGRHWRRAKFFERFRLFFRFRSKAKIIVYAWVNDESTLRARGAKNDAYEVFRRRLASGNPPDDWDDLVSSSGAP
jgi:toxin YhaV